MSVDVRQSPTAPSTVPDTVPASWVYRPKFPTPDLLAFVRDFIPAEPAWDGQEGPRARLIYAPGMVAVSLNNLARREKAIERGRPWAIDRMMWVDGVQQLERTSEHMGGRAATISLQVAIHTAEHEKAGTEPGACDGTCPHWPQKPPPRQEITHWSSKSRGRMWKTLHQVDYGTTKAGRPWIRPGRPPTMVTLTYPGDWYAAAPTGKDAKRHWNAFIRRYERAWKEPFVCIWKEEFQRRGAPHFHFQMIVPLGKAAAGRHKGLRFREWLSETWADVVAAQDPEDRENNRKYGTKVNSKDGLKARNPADVAHYFSKHGSFRKKEYQNNVPLEWQGPGRGPGRFWGVRGLRKLVYAVELSAADAVQAARMLRRWADARGITRERAAPRVKAGRARSDQAAVIGLAGMAYADHRPRLTLTPDGALTWRNTPVSDHVRVRPTRGPAQYMRGGAGWVSTKDGAVMAEQVGRFLAHRYEQRRAELLAEDRERSRARYVEHVLNRRDRPPP